MTIIEAASTVLQSAPKGMSVQEIYEKIIEQILYIFKAQNPVNVLNIQIRRHCQGLDFPTASRVKKFYISGKKGKKAAVFTFI